MSNWCARLSLEKYWQRWRRLITDMSLRVEDVAHDAGLSSGYLYGILRGEVESPSYKVVEGVAKALNIPPDYLMGGKDVDGASLAATEQIMRDLALRFGGPTADPTELAAWLEWYFKLTPQERAERFEAWEWSEERKRRDLKRVAEEAGEYKAEG